MRRWNIARMVWASAVGAMALGAVGSGQAQAPKPAAPSDPPDVLVLIYQQPGKGDLIDITYAQTVPHAQAQRDLAALAQATGWSVGPGKVTDGSAPVQNKFGQMTSSVLTVPNIIQNEAHSLPLEPFIAAFREYKRLALIFSVSPGFQFQGLRDYADKNVQITQEQRGTVYAYQVRILNPHFDRLNLPQTQLTAGPAAGTARRPASPWRMLLGLAAVALAAGVIVYVLMARKTPPPAVNTDTLSEEQTNIGAQG